jgi:hypothetical protein
MTNTADVTGGKPIIVRLQSPFIDGRKRDVLFYSSTLNGILEYTSIRTTHPLSPKG